MKNFLVVLVLLVACNDPQAKLKTGDVNVNLDSLKADVKPVADSINSGLEKAGEKVKKAAKKVDSMVKIKIE